MVCGDVMIHSKGLTGTLGGRIPGWYGPVPTLQRSWKNVTGTKTDQLRTTETLFKTDVHPGQSIVVHSIIHSLLILPQGSKKTVQSLPSVELIDTIFTRKLSVETFVNFTYRRFVSPCFLLITFEIMVFVLSFVLFIVIYVFHINNILICTVYSEQ